MKYIVDADLHIHSELSLCSEDPEQTTERILRYAEENGLKTICLTDHFWDGNVPGGTDWYRRQDYSHISAAKPLPQSGNVRFLFGCETELDCDLNLAITKESFEKFDFVIIPTTHFHIKGLVLTEEDMANAESRAKAWLRRLEGVLDMDLPFHKIGLAHLTNTSFGETKEEYLEVLKLLPEEEMRRLFGKAAELGVGIELNASALRFVEDDADIVLRPYRIAKECGCKFYCGSDAHHPDIFDISKAIFEKVTTMLSLTEEDKFKI